MSASDMVDDSSLFDVVEDSSLFDMVDDFSLFDMTSKSPDVVDYAQFNEADAEGFTDGPAKFLAQCREHEKEAVYNEADAEGFTDGPAAASKSTPSSIRGADKAPTSRSNQYSVSAASLPAPSVSECDSFFSCETLPASRSSPSAHITADDLVSLGAASSVQPQALRGPSPSSSASVYSDYSSGCSSFHSSIDSPMYFRHRQGMASTRGYSLHSSVHTRAPPPAVGSKVNGAFVAAGPVPR